MEKFEYMLQMTAARIRYLNEDRLEGYIREPLPKEVLGEIEYRMADLESEHLDLSAATKEYQTSKCIGCVEAI